MSKNANPFVSMFSDIRRTRKISDRQMILWTIIIIGVVVAIFAKPNSLDLVIRLTVK